MTTSSRRATVTGALPWALPFFVSLLLVPLFVWSVSQGGATPLIVPLAAWLGSWLADLVAGHNRANADPATPTAAMALHRALTIIWWPLQTGMLLWALIYITYGPDIGLGTKLASFAALGIIAGTIGIVYAHELMHQPCKLERWCADLLLASVLYSHFRSEHLLVHHVHVGTPKDPVTAPYGEGFWRFYMRVLPASLRSAWAAEAARLNKSGRQTLDARNPFWRYWTLQVAYLLVVLVIAGWPGLFFFAIQASVAVWQLELINYIEHYGLTRKLQDDGTYERQGAHHSWDGSQRATNWLLINLQRHSDHHIHPNRRYPVLQHLGRDQAPQLPFGYAAMGILALMPHLWRKRMNPRVKAWRAKYYPEIADWRPYNRRAFRS